MVRDALVGNFALLDCLFSYWRVDEPDMGVFVSFVRLMDFLMHDRFYAFVRYLSMTGAWVLQRIVRQVRARCLGVCGHCCARVRIRRFSLRLKVSLAVTRARRAHATAWYDYKRGLSGGT